MGMMTRMRTGNPGDEVEHAGDVADEGEDAVATVDVAADVDPDADPRRMFMRMLLTMTMRLCMKMLVSMLAEFTLFVRCGCCCHVNEYGSEDVEELWVWMIFVGRRWG